MNALVRSTDTAVVVENGDTQLSAQCLTFAVARDTYALAIDRIREIIEFGQLTTVPCMPPFIRGVLNLRGAVVPVIDLASRFGEALSEVGRRTCIVIVELEAGNGPQVVGLMVDAVHEVVDIGASDIGPTPAFGTRVQSQFIAGMARRNDRFIVLLDATRVLSIDEIEGIGAVAASS
ncbi:MAG TPA: chemotaxis protein CheW [Arenimonas sp.]|nr:chemotaxis protein CheW [Arenimonas sp.]